jgi:TrmH family RNA methyltransferase
VAQFAFFHIDSPQNPKIKSAAELWESKHRRQRKEFLIEGRRELKRALTAKVAVTDVFVHEEAKEDLEVGEVLSLLPSYTRLISVSKRVYEKLAMREGTEHLIAIATEPASDALSTLGNPTCLAIIDGVEKPGNIGAILRSMDGSGASGLLIASSKPVDYFNPNAIRASQGAIFSVPRWVGSDAEILKLLNERRIQVVALDPDAGQDYCDLDLSIPHALVVGNEAQGLSSFWRQHAHVCVRIPMLGVCDSLNASVSVAVVLYDALRQRKFARHAPN